MAEGLSAAELPTLIISEFAAVNFRPITHPISGTPIAVWIM
jgi:hypothetical protein